MALSFAHSQSVISERPLRKHGASWQKIRPLDAQGKSSFPAFCQPMKKMYKTLIHSSQNFPNPIANHADDENHLPFKDPSHKRKLYKPKALNPTKTSLVEDNYSISSLNNFLKKLKALYEFSRPYTVMGTIVGVTSISLLPLETISDLSAPFFVGLLKALVPTIWINVYVAGLNQLFDVEIDKVNKPFLPLASGELSMNQGSAIVAISCIVSFASAVVFQSPPLLFTVASAFLLANAYSINTPLLRWKRNSILTALSITFMRGLVIPISIFTHVQKYVLRRPVVFTRSLALTIFFMCTISTIIALIKDIPDVEGDKAFGLRTLTINLGKDRVFKLCVNALLMTYGVAVTVGFTSPFIFSKIVTVLGHCTMAGILCLRARSVDLSDKASTLAFYMFVWKLLCAEYFLIPFVR